MSGPIMLLAGFGVTVLGFFGKEVPALCEHLAPKVAKRAAARLPKSVRGGFEEEWLAELDAMKGLQVIRLLWAFGYYRSTFKLLKMPSVMLAAETDKKIEADAALKAIAEANARRLLQEGKANPGDTVIVTSNGTTSSATITLTAEGLRSPKAGAEGHIELGGRVGGPPPNDVTAFLKERADRARVMERRRDRWREEEKRRWSQDSSSADSD